MDRVDRDTLDRELEVGAVIAIEHHLSTARGLWPLGHGGSLYLVVTGARGKLWLVGVLEAPEQSQLRPRDRRARGWYAPANVTPITDLTGKLTIGKLPRTLTVKEEALLRELLDESDAPLIDGDARDSSPAIVPEGTPLECVVAYLACGDARSALGPLLEAWRDTRAVALADLIDRTSRVLPTFDRPLAVDRLDDAAVDKAWEQAFAKDSTAAMTQLLQYVSVGDRVSQRWSRLASLSADPRIARRLAARMHDLIRDEALEIIERTRDATSWAAAKELAAEIEIMAEDGPDRDGAYEMISLAESGRLAFADKSPAGKLTKPAQQLVVAIEAELDRLEAPRRTERDLVDAIADDWKDDGPRSIYADWLIERGHPRGEYLSLILRGEKLSPAQRRRFALLSDVPYQYGILDEMAVMQHRVRDRGIDRSLDIYWSTAPLMWRAGAQSPLIRALTKIRLVGDSRHGRAEAIAAFVAAAPHLATIEGVNAADAKQLVRCLGRGWKPDRGRLVRTS